MNSPTQNGAEMPGKFPADERAEGYADRTERKADTEEEKIEMPALNEKSRQCRTGAGRE